MKSGLSSLYLPFLGLGLLSGSAEGFATTTNAAKGGPWENLLPENADAPVRKQILEPSASGKPTPKKGLTVEIEYSGSLWMEADDGFGISIPSWSKETVLEYWLSEQQGLCEDLSGPFEEHSVDGSALLDEELFTEAYVAETLGLAASKIKCKKTMMAARRLRSTLTDFPHGTVFDSSSSYEFVLGAGKTIKAMELLVASMEEGETSSVVARCDYGYGADGFRTSKGEVMVPPFCGLRFDVTLLSVR